ncbi:MAG: MFS transporter [Candidatus Sumerlaeota bacterium]|nr:MFS transporter [Candidatus Sumerlaeota bacterium]
MPELNSQRRFAVMYFALFSVFAVITPYLQKILRLQGFDKEQIGYIQAALETAGILAPPLWGRLSDFARRRRRLIAIVIAGACASFLCLGQLSAEAHSALMIAMGMAAVFGLFYKAVIPLTDGLVLRYLSEHGGDYGRPRAAGSVSFILTIAIMEALGVAGEHGRAIILVTTLVCTIIHLSTISLLPLTQSEKEERHAPVRRRRHFDASLFLSRPFVAFASIAFLNSFAMAGYYGFFTLFLQEEIGFPQAGYIWILGPLSEIPMIFFSSAIIRRIGARNMLALGVAGTVVRLTGLAIAPNLWWVLPLQALHALTFGAFHTSSIHFLNRLAPPDMKQSATTLFSALALGCAAIAGNAIGGTLIEHCGYRAMYGIYGGVALIGLIGLFTFVREPKPLESQIH